MTPFELGVKLATSRWREAIRSGEVSDLGAQRIKDFMQFNPQDFGSRMLQAGLNRVRGMGYDAETIPRTSNLRGWPKFKQGVKRQLADAGGGGITMPKWKKILFSEEAGPLVKLHETGEGLRGERFIAGNSFYPTSSRVSPTGQSALKSFYQKSSNPVSRYLSRTKGMLHGAFTGAHASADLPIEDIRNIRLLSSSSGGLPTNPEARWLFEARGSTGERGLIGEASKNITGRTGYLPRKALKQISSETERLNRLKAIRLGHISPTAFSGTSTPLWPAGTHVYPMEQGNLFPRGPSVRRPSPTATLFERLPFGKAIEAQGKLLSHPSRFAERAAPIGKQLALPLKKNIGQRLISLLSRGKVR